MTSFYYLCMRAKPKSNEKPISEIQRRAFLKAMAKTTGKVTVAMTSTYLVSWITNKNGNTAGAK